MYEYLICFLFSPIQDCAEAGSRARDSDDREERNDADEGRPIDDNKKFVLLISYLSN